MRSKIRRQAFTLVELLVAMAIIAMLIGLSLAGVQRVRNSAERARCLNNLRQVGLALHQYQSQTGVLPAGLRTVRAPGEFRFMGWHARLLPYVEAGHLWQQTVEAYGLEPRPFYNPPHVVLGTVVPTFTCPLDERVLYPREFRGRSVSLTSFLGVSGTDLHRRDGLLYPNSAVRFTDITDGLSNTVAAGERPPYDDNRFGWWYAGIGQRGTGSCDMILGVRELNILTTEAGGCQDGPYHFEPGRGEDFCNSFHFWSLHPGGAHFLFADGSVRFLAYSADPIMPALATRAGGEPVTVPD